MYIYFFDFYPATRFCRGKKTNLATVQRVQQSCRFIKGEAFSLLLLLISITAAALCEYVYKGFTLFVSTSQAQ